MDQLPLSLQRVPPAAIPFNAASRSQSEADHGMEPANLAKERGRIVSGSAMVQREVPAPKLRPENHKDVDKEIFNQAWLREARDAHLECLQAQRENVSGANIRSQNPDYTGPMPMR